MPSPARKKQNIKPRRVYTVLLDPLNSFQTNTPQMAALVVVAVILNGAASGKKAGNAQISKADQRKGIILAVVAGVVMSFFSSFVMKAMDLKDFANMEPGKVGPYTAIVLFSLSVLVSHFVFGPIFMKWPFQGEPVKMSEYFKGNSKTHLVGMLGGCIWCLGTALSYITAGKAGASVSYALFIK